MHNTMKHRSNSIFNLVGTLGLEAASLVFFRGLAMVSASSYWQAKRDPFGVTRNGGTDFTTSLLQPWNDRHHWPT